MRDCFSRPKYWLLALQKQQPKLPPFWKFPTIPRATSKRSNRWHVQDVWSFVTWPKGQPKKKEKSEIHLFVSFCSLPQYKLRQVDLKILSLQRYLFEQFGLQGSYVEKYLPEGNLEWYSGYTRHAGNSFIEAVYGHLERNFPEKKYPRCS